MPQPLKIIPSASEQVAGPTDHAGLQKQPPTVMPGTLVLPPVLLSQALIGSFLRASAFAVIQSAYSDTRVYTPGESGVAQPTPPTEK